MECSWLKVEKLSTPQLQMVEVAEYIPKPTLSTVGLSKTWLLSKQVFDAVG